VSRRSGIIGRPTVQELASHYRDSGSGLELRTDSLYDIRTCLADSSETHFFQSPLGTPSIDRNVFSTDRRHYDRTNMVLAGCLPSPQRMLVQAIRLEIYCDGAVRERERAYGMVYAHGYLQFMIGSHMMHSGARLGNYMGYGYPLDYPALIEPNQNFVVSLYWPEIRLRKAADIGVYLDGTRVMSSI
jgi:hypothetical protein